MAIFRRSRDTQLAAIAQFWEWWAQVHSRVLAAPTDPELTGAVAQHVTAIHPGLAWEISPAPSLTLTGGGDGELRGIAERWRRAAPENDGWEYHAARRPDPEALSGKLQLDDQEFDLEYVRLGLRADARRARVDVTAYHPDYLFVPEDTRAAVTTHVLDAALGEDEVARWIGTVRTATEAPMDALPPNTLSAVVEQIAVREPVWLTGEGRTPLGHAARVAARFPLHRQDHPLCDEHVAITVPYAHTNPDRLPVEPSATALRIFEDALAEMTPHIALTAHETGDGRRVFHLYADLDSGIVAELDQLAASWSEGRAKVVSQPDPAWERFAPFQP